MRDAVRAFDPERAADVAAYVDGAGPLKAESGEAFVAEIAEAYAARGNIDLTQVVLDNDHSFSWKRIELSERVLARLDDNCR